MSPAATNAAIPLSRQREKPGQSLKWIGKSMKRVEDPRLLTGQGRYIDDIDLPNMLHAAVLRSSRPHAKITARRRHTRAPRRAQETWPCGLRQQS